MEQTIVLTLEDDGMLRMTAVSGDALLIIPAERVRVTVRQMQTVLTLDGPGAETISVSTPSTSPQLNIPTTRPGLATPPVTTAATGSATKTTTGAETNAFDHLLKLIEFCSDQLKSIFFLFIILLNNRCGDNVAGCVSNEDCKDGHYCDITMDQPTCFEIDECDIDNVFFNGSAYCGEEATCTNTVGSFTCTCLTGFISHTAWVGCRSAVTYY